MNAVLPNLYTSYRRHNTTMEALFAAIDATTSATVSWESLDSVQVVHSISQSNGNERVQSEQVQQENTTINSTKLPIQHQLGNNADYQDAAPSLVSREESAEIKPDELCATYTSSADEVDVVKRHRAVTQALQCEKVEDSASEEDDVTKNDVYHTKRALAHVKVF